MVAFGLHNDELRFPPEPFEEAFAIARERGCWPHRTPVSSRRRRSIRASLDALGADRIQHGIRAVEDPALVELLARRQVTLDVCPTSNLVLEVVPSMAAHPLGQLLAAGVLCSINGDDPIDVRLRPGVGVPGVPR